MARFLIWGHAHARNRDIFLSSDVISAYIENLESYDYMTMKMISRK